MKGDNVVELSENTPWYTGKPMLDFLETIEIANDNNFSDFRFPVQYVLRPKLDFRGFSGTIASGIIRKGDEIVALPSGKRSHVKSIVTYDDELEYAYPPQAVTITLEDEIDISRGEMIVKPDNMPEIGRRFTAMMVWMDEEPMDREKKFFIKQTTNLSRVKIENIEYRIDVNTMKKSSVDALSLNEIGKVEITSSKQLFFDPYSVNKHTGAFILIDPISNNTSAVGMIVDKLSDIDAENDIPTINLKELGIGEECYEAVDRIKKSLENQGIGIKVIK